MKIIHHVLIGRGLQFLKDKDVFPDASCLLGALFEDGRHAHLEASVDESSKGGNSIMEQVDQYPVQIFIIRDEAATTFSVGISDMRLQQSIDSPTQLVDPGHHGL